MCTGSIWLSGQADEPFAGHLDDAWVALLELASNRRGAQLSHNFATVGHLDHFPFSNLADVLAESIFDLTDTSLSHAANVASGGQLVNGKTTAIYTHVLNKGGGSCGAPWMSSDRPARLYDRPGDA